MMVMTWQSAGKNTTVTDNCHNVSERIVKVGDEDDN